MEECLYKKNKCLENINEFLCIYLGEGKGGGGLNWVHL